MTRDPAQSTGPAQQTGAAQGRPRSAVPRAPLGKVVFVTGGVVSALGKGIAAASLGRLLVARGLSVSALKLDPYLNVDPGTQSPSEHGECYVLADGTECDLDLGHYSRFLSEDLVLGRANSLTQGRVFRDLLDAERDGDHLGQTVQVVPHVTDAIKRAIKEALAGHDVLLVEIGGTVGDIESQPFIEAMRQFRLEAGPHNTALIHLALVPFLRSAKELKTKPAQASVKELMQRGVIPDMLLCRVDRPLPDAVRRKLALFCNVRIEHVIEGPDVEDIYELPLRWHAQGVDAQLTALLGIASHEPRLADWRAMVARSSHPTHTVRIAVCGKYTDGEFSDAYKSVQEALAHGGIANDARVEIEWIPSESLSSTTDVAARLTGVSGLLVPGGFGTRGTEGMLHALAYARESGLPAFGICLGMQLMTIESARNLLGLPGASSTEFDPKCTDPVIYLMEGQRGAAGKGGTMRLGQYPCVLRAGSRAGEAYGTLRIAERHRHRFEVNAAYVSRLAAVGLVASGTSPNGRLVEMVERPLHPWFVGCQFHPELLSTPLVPHPLFAAFVAAACARDACGAGEQSRT